MFRIFSKGWDGFVLMPAKRSRELQGGGLSGLVFIILAVFLAALFGDVLSLPIACILLAIGISAAFGGRENLFFLTPVALPVLAFGFLDACWEMFRSTTILNEGPLGVVGWLLMGVLGVLLCIRELEARPLSGAIMLVIVGALWIIPVTMLFSGDEVFVGYVFYVICAIGAFLTAVAVIRFIIRLFIKGIYFRGIFVGLLLIVLGAVPIAAVYFTRGIWTSVWAPTIRVAAMILLYLILAVIGRAFASAGDREPAFEMNYLLLPFTFIGAVYFIVSRLSAITVPIVGIDKILAVFRGGFWITIAAVGQNVLSAVSDLFTVIGNFVVMMVVRLFGVSVPYFRVPLLASFLLGLGFVYLVIRLGMLIERGGRE